jgi:hypothetical protein
MSYVTVVEEEEFLLATNEEEFDPGWGTLGQMLVFLVLNLQ